MITKVEKVKRILHEPKRTKADESFKKTEVYKLWKNEFVVLDCGTGCGKTYFSLHVLGNYAKKQKKKILYLCNRRKLRKQSYSDTKSLGLLNVV